MKSFFQKRIHNWDQNQNVGMEFNPQGSKWLKWAPSPKNIADKN